jgi:inorganic pyrophosphatase
MTKNYSEKKDLEKAPRSIVLKRILAFSKSYKNSKKKLKVDSLEN